jgi:hypothetical protein
MDEGGAPFSVATVENQDGISDLEPQRVYDVIRLSGIQWNVLSLLKGGIDVNAGGAEVMAVHGGEMPRAASIDEVAKGNYH